MVCGFRAIDVVELDTRGIRCSCNGYRIANSPENQAQKPRESADDSDFPPLAAVPLLLDVTDAIDSENDRPLADLFPDAYE